VRQYRPGTRRVNSRLAAGVGPWEVATCATPTAERRAPRAADAAVAEERRKPPLGTEVGTKPLERETTSGRSGLPDAVPLLSWPWRDSDCPVGVLQFCAFVCVARSAPARSGFRSRDGVSSQISRVQPQLRSDPESEVQVVPRPAIVLETRHRSVHAETRVHEKERRPELAAHECLARLQLGRRSPRAHGGAE
jgi:hypothetical protein